MKLGINIGYSGRTFHPPVEQVKEAEAMGCDSLWTAEAYGSDALTPLAWLGAHTTKIKLATGIVQISARTPAATAMAMKRSRTVSRNSIWRARRRTQRRPFRPS
jgi:alkanesulfonate monooxygenase SsuD/methylene tetrahydromethanopterin reductase-like flavin-dependent oxidoreductase (luciferase family)